MRGIARLILVNGPPASGKSTLARRYVDGHDGVVLVEVDTLRMTLPNWEEDEATRLAARDLAAAAVVEHLCAGRDVVTSRVATFGQISLVVTASCNPRTFGKGFGFVGKTLDNGFNIGRGCLIGDDLPREQ